MYYQITFTLDKRIRGRYEMPHTVKIKSKDFLDYVSEKIGIFRCILRISTTYILICPMK